MKLFVAQLSACVLLAIAVLAGVELYLRYSIPSSSRESIYEYTLASKRYKVMKPSTMVVAWGKELKTNELGFRDAAPALAPKRAGEFRIVVLGDSFTVSAGVDFALIYSSLLEARLKQMRPGVRILNLAVGGYNVVQYAAVLEEVGLALEPDMVLVALYPENDFSMDNYEENYRVASGQDPATTDLPWHQSLYVYRAYLRRVETRISKWFQKEPKTAGPDKGWEANLAALRSIAEAAKSRGIPLAVAALPSTWNLPTQRELFKRVEDHCRKEALACLNLLEPFIASGVEESALRLNVLDAHPNEKYNALVAAHLTPFVSGFLK